MTDWLTIEDDDGFTTRWPWPEGRSMLYAADFVDLCLAQHEAARGERNRATVNEGAGR